ncbi:unnamed protein product [Orchesella dallaii]|uniref:Uncharacterized protein n=1 Tax=Orchesella dallaii TaxID=48710 RepID=A0ABP1Q6P0_9HEXA
MDLSKTTRFRNFCVTKDYGIRYCSIDPRRGFIDPLWIEKIESDRRASGPSSTDISLEQCIPIDLSLSPTHASLPNTSHSFLTTSSRSSSASSIVSCTSESNLQEAISLIKHRTFEKSTAAKSPFELEDNAEFIFEKSLPSTPNVPTKLLNGNDIFEIEDVSNCESEPTVPTRKRRCDYPTVIPSESMVTHQTSLDMLSSLPPFRRQRRRRRRRDRVHLYSSRVTPAVPEVALCGGVPTQNLIPNRLTSIQLSERVLPPSEECDVQSSTYREYAPSKNTKANANWKQEEASELYNSPNTSDWNDKGNSDELKLSPYITAEQAAERQRILGTKKAQHEINVFAALISARIGFEEQVEANRVRNNTISLTSTISERPATTMTHHPSHNLGRERFERLSE